MALPGPHGASGPPEGPRNPNESLHLVEASEARERTCADCGRRTSTWKPVRRGGVVVILCPECAAKPAPGEEAEHCPACGAARGPRDAFCGRCGIRIEYACPRCGASVEVQDRFCGQCGTRVD